MSDLVLLPDIEQLISNFLRDQEEVTDLCPNIFTELPAKFSSWPAIRVTQFNTLHRTQRPLWLAGYPTQIEAFGGPKKTAWRIATTCMAVLERHLPGVHDDAVVTGVNFSGLRSQPDTTYHPAKPRVLFVATPYAHPNPAGAGS